MPIDASIYQNIQSTPVQTPMQSVGQALSMASLAQKTQLQNLQYQDQMATRKAFLNNVVPDANGNPTINRAGVLSDLSKTNPMQAMQLGQQFRQMDLQKLQQQHEIGKELLFSQPMGSNVSDEDKQAAWSDMLQKGQSLGLPIDHLPQQRPDDDSLRALQKQSLSADEQLAQMNKDVEHNLTAQDLEVKRQQFMYGKQQDAMQNAMQQLNSSRQTDDVKQAYMDRYNAGKGLEIIGQYKNPDQMPLAIYNNLVGEVGKVAQGAAPTEPELKNLSQTNAKSILAKTETYAKSYPAAGKQGAFIMAYRDYLSGLQNNANKVIQEKIGKTLESYRPRLANTDYQNLRTQFLNGNPNLQAPAPGGQIQAAGKSGVMSFDDWRAQQASNGGSK